MPVSSEVSTGRHRPPIKVLPGLFPLRVIRTAFTRQCVRSRIGERCMVNGEHPPTPGGRSEVCATCAGNRSVLTLRTPANWGQGGIQSLEPRPTGNHPVSHADKKAPFEKNQQIKMDSKRADRQAAGSSLWVDRSEPRPTFSNTRKKGYLGGTNSKPGNKIGEQVGL